MNGITWDIVAALFPLRIEATFFVLREKITSEFDLNSRWYSRAPYGAWNANRVETANNHEVLKNYVGPIFGDIGGPLEYRGN